MAKAAENKISFDKNLSFEDAMADLENIVRQLEGGHVKLEDAVGLYEKGAALKKHCDTKLKEAKLKVEKITVNASGNISASKVDDGNLGG